MHLKKSLSCVSLYMVYIYNSIQLNGNVSPQGPLFIEWDVGRGGVLQPLRYLLM